MPKIKINGKWLQAVKLGDFKNSYILKRKTEAVMKALQI